MKTIKVNDLNIDLNKKEIIKMYKSFFAFKKRIPVFIIKRRIKQNKYSLIKYFDSNELVGFSIYYNEDRYILLQYIVINKSKQGKGYGSQILKMLLDEHKDKTVFLSCEYYDESSKTKEKENRLNFYLRNGLIKNDFLVSEYGVSYFVLSNKTMHKDEYINVINNCFHKLLAKLFFKTI